MIFDRNVTDKVIIRLFFPPDLTNTSSDYRPFIDVIQTNTEIADKQDSLYTWLCCIAVCKTVNKLTNNPVNIVK